MKRWPPRPFAILFAAATRAKMANPEIRRTDKRRQRTKNAVEDQHGNEATDNEQRTVHKASGIGHVDEITDNGQRITDKTEIVGGELSEEQFRATRFALWQEQDARSRITLPN